MYENQPLYINEHPAGNPQNQTDAVRGNYVSFTSHVITCEILHP